MRVFKMSVESSLPAFSCIIPVSNTFINAPSRDQLGRELCHIWPSGTRMQITEYLIPPTSTKYFTHHSTLINDADISPNANELPRHYSILHYKPRPLAQHREQVFLSEVPDIRTSIPIYPAPQFFFSRIDSVFRDTLQNVKLPHGWSIKALDPNANLKRAIPSMYMRTSYIQDGKPHLAKMMTVPPNRVIDLINPQMQKNRHKYATVRVSQHGQYPLLAIFVDCSLKEAARRARQYAEVCPRHLVEVMKGVEYYENEKELWEEINQVFSKTMGDEHNSDVTHDIIKTRTKLEIELINIKKDTLEQDLDENSSGATNAFSTRINHACSTKRPTLNVQNAEDVTPIPYHAVNEPFNEQSLLPMPISEQNNANQTYSNEQYQQQPPPQKNPTLHQKFSKLPLFCVLITDDAWCWTAACSRDNGTSINCSMPVLGAN